MSTLIKPISRDQSRAMLMGLAVGSAMGNARHGLQAGQWTGVASQAFCMAQMLRSANGWDPEDVMRRFGNWRDHGYLSSTRQCFDLPAHVAQALDRFAASGSPYAGPAEETDAVAIARLAPVVIAYAGRVESAVAVAQLQARLTHGDRASAQAAGVVAEFMVTGESSVLSAVETPPNAPRSVRDVLDAAIWALGQGGGFTDALARAVALGGDTDVVGAVTGQLAGRRFGYDALPRDALARLHDHDKILLMADDLHGMRPIDV